MRRCLLSGAALVVVLASTACGPQPESLDSAYQDTRAQLVQIDSIVEKSSFSFGPAEAAVREELARGRPTTLASGAPVLGDPQTIDN